jgi:DNA replication protein DnaC
MPTRVWATIKHCAAGGHWPLYLWGSTGIGKTCAAAVAYSLWRPSAWWMSLTELCDTLKGFNAQSFQLITTPTGKIELSLTGFWERMRKMGLVVIDEIGTRDASPQRYDALLRLLETRQGQPLILTGNLNPRGEIPKVYDERVQSRIYAGVALEVTGPDRRLDGIKERLPR